MRIERFHNIPKNIRLCWKKYRFHRSLLLVGDVIISRDSPVTNGEKETSLVTEILSKPGHLNACVVEPCCGS